MDTKTVTPFAVIGTIVDCESDTQWALRIDQQGLLVIDNQGAIAYRGTKNDLQDVKEKFSVDQVIELEDKNEFLLPGLIDSHIHASQYPNAGLGLDLPLLEWLKKYTFPMERRFGEDLGFARDAYERVVRSTLAHGTTTAAYYATIDLDASLVLADVVQDLGQRALVGKVCIDRNGFEKYQETTADSLSATKSFVASVLERKCATLEPIITPRFVPACTKELLTDLGAYGAETGVKIQTHLSECRPEVEWVKELEPWAENYTDVYAKTGILTDKTILAHGVYLSDDEINTIQAFGSGISHCASSNNSIRSGNMDVIKYHGFKGLKLGMGTDCSGGYSPSMLNSMRFAIATSNTISISQYPKVRPNYDYIGAIALATRGSAKVCGLESKVGGFDVGLQFDALRVRMNASNMDTCLFGFETVHDMIHKFVFLGDDRNIAQVFVNGKCVKNINPT